MYCNLKNKEECLPENHQEFKTKYFTAKFCIDCGSKDYVAEKGCCNQPDIRPVNQPRADGLPLKKNLCFNCGASKVVKMSHSNEWRELQVVTKEESEKIINKVDQRRKDFQEYVISERQKIYDKKNEEFWDKYTSYLGTKEWQTIRKKILERDNFICQSCLENKATDVHHKTYANVFNEHAFELVSLCRSCHDRYHDYKYSQSC